MADNQQQQPQHNRPHPNQAPRPAEQASQVEVTKTLDAQESKGKLQARSIGELIALEKGSLSFRELLSLLVTNIVEDKITPAQARQYIHTWYNSKSDDEKQEFKSARNQADETINFFRGVI